MIWDSLTSTNKPFFALAPMNDVTDTVFRQIVGRCGAPDVYFTEFVSVDSLSSPGKRHMDSKLAYTQNEQPLIVQIWGNNIGNYEKRSYELAQKGYLGIDINMGCPVSKIITKGACSALITNRTKAKEIIDATRTGIKASKTNIALSVKTRIGFEKIDLTWIEFLLEQNLDCLTVHCRTAEEQSRVPNHFEVLPEIVEMRNTVSPNTKIIANGDITTRTQGEELAKQYLLDGIMIGRGIFHDPYTFAETSPWETMTPQEKAALYSQHIDLFEETWQGQRNPEVLKRFAKTYINGFDGAAKVRDDIMNLSDIAQIRKYIAAI